MPAMPHARRTRLMLGLLILAAAVLFLIGNASVPLWDRDEPRYAQTSRQMLQSGDWVVPRLLDQVRTAKPIFMYWCQASAMRIFGDNAFAARFPSVVAMLTLLVVLAVVIDRTIGPRRALWTVFIFSTSGLVIAAAKMCLTDSVLLLWVTIAQVCLLSVYANSESRLSMSIVMWIAIGVAGLTKGPVVIGVQLTTIIVLAVLDVGRDYRNPRAWLSATRWWPRTHPLIGIVIVAVICGPWLLLVHRREPTFLPQIIGHDIWTRMRRPLEGHSGPPGYYLLTIWLTYFPWSLLLPAALVWGWKRRINPIVRFSLAAIIGPWVMFEIVQTKLLHYILPIFPFLAFLTADMLIRQKKGELKSAAFLGAVRGWSVVVALLGLVSWIAIFKVELPAGAFVAMALLSVLGFEYGRTVLRFFTAGRVLDAAAALGIGMMIVVAVIYGMYFPNATFLHVAPRVAQVLKDEGAVDPGDVVMIDFKEDSLAFYQGGTIRRENDAFLLTHERWEWPQWIVMTERLWQTMPESIRNEFDVLRTIRGWWYVKGLRTVDVIVLRKKSPFALASLPPWFNPIVQSILLR